MATRLPVALLTAAAFVAAVQCAALRHDVLVADLVLAYDDARKQPDASAFARATVAIGDVARPAIVSAPQTRLTFHITLPKHAEFRTGIAVRPAGGMVSAPHVEFLIGVSDGRTYRTLRSVAIAPMAGPGDTRWHDVAISLEEYADLTIDLILNTRSDAVPSGTADQHVATWGHPRVVTR